MSLKTADPTRDGGSDPGRRWQSRRSGCRMPHREGGTGVARLAELADGYMDAAVRLRMGLEEVRAELETPRTVGGGRWRGGPSCSGRC